MSRGVSLHTYPEIVLNLLDIVGQQGRGQDARRVPKDALGRAQGRVGLVEGAGEGLGVGDVDGKRLDVEGFLFLDRFQ